MQPSETRMSNYQEVGMHLLGAQTAFFPVLVGFISVGAVNLQCISVHE